MFYTESLVSCCFFEAWVGVQDLGRILYDSFSGFRGFRVEDVRRLGV